MSIIEKALKKAGDRGLLDESLAQPELPAVAVEQFVVPDAVEPPSLVVDVAKLDHEAQPDVIDTPSVFSDSVVDTKPDFTPAGSESTDIQASSTAVTYRPVTENIESVAVTTERLAVDEPAVLSAVDVALLGLEDLPNVEETVFKPRSEPELSSNDDELVANAEIRSVVAQKISQSSSDSKPIFDNQVVIDWDVLAKQGYLDNNDTKSQLSEEFRIIKRPLVNNIQSSASNGIARANLILVCSSLPGEGKTFISINLALSIANERDRNVLLIDADVEKPSVSKRLGVKQSPGLIEYLEDENVTFADILLKTDLPNLSVIPAGKRHKYSTELLSSQRMHMFAEEVSQRYPDRVVIFDSPPLLVATQAHALAEFVGQVVLVVAAESTQQSAVSESVAKLSKCDVVMTLLNKTKKDFDIYGYGYGYGTYGR